MKPPAHSHVVVGFYKLVPFVNMKHFFSVS